MSVILMLTSTLTGEGGLSTSSGIAMTDILTGAAIVGAGLLVSFTATELLSYIRGWNKNVAATVRGINVTLLIVFCTFIAFRIAKLL
jgi:hypothetical protein